MPENLDSPPEERFRILEQARTITVVGLSPNELHASHAVASEMQQLGYRIIPVNPNITGVLLGEKAYSRLEDVPVPVDIVDIFRPSATVPPVVESAIRIGAKAIWMQQGVEHPKAARRAHKAGLVVAMNRCISEDHYRWRVGKRSGKRKSG